MSLDTVPDFAQGSTIGVPLILPSLDGDAACALVPAGWTTHASYLRTVAQPEATPA